MRRYLLVCAVTAVALEVIAPFAVAQTPSAVSSGDNRSASSYAQPQVSLAGIRSSKAVEIVANGISPRTLAIDADGNVYLTNAAAPNRIFTITGLADLAFRGEAVDPSARLALIAGTGVAGSLGDGGNAANAQFSLALASLQMRSEIAVATDGTMFVADTLNSTIRRIAGSDSAEPGVMRSIAGRWASSPGSRIVEPVGLAVDRSGNLYASDHTSGAVDFLPNATQSSPGEQQVRLLAHVAAPAAVALTEDGRKAFVASPDTGTILEIDTQTRSIQAVAALTAHNADSETELKEACGAPAAQTMTSPICPAGIAVDGTGNLFLADANSGSILRVDAKTTALTTVATGLHSPGDMSFDRSGDLYVSEQAANRILKFVSMGAAPSNLTLTPPAPLPPPASPRVCPQTAPFNFCDQPVGGTTATQAFTLTNNTTAAVTGIAISFTGSNPADFQVPSNTCGTSLAAGASCAINADFAPTTSGSRSAALQVTDSAADSATAQVTGTGDDYQIVLNGSPEEQSVIQGGTLTYNFNIVPDAVFGGTVSIVCPSNLPTLSTCAPSKSTVTVTPGTPATFSMTFQTTYDGVTGGLPTNGVVPGFPIPGGGNGPAAQLAWLSDGLLLLFALAVLARSRTERSIFERLSPSAAFWAGTFLLLGCCIVFLAGCKHSSVPASLNTPTGSTTLTVQGTAQNSGRAATIVLDVVGRG